MHSWLKPSDVSILLGCLVSAGSFSRPFSRQRPIEPATPVHVLPCSPFLFRFHCACICGLILHMLALRGIKDEWDAHHSHHIYFLSSDVGVKVHSLHQMPFLMLASKTVQAFIYRNGPQHGFCFTWQSWCKAEVLS